jgi:hypothetical protein
MSRPVNPHSFAALYQTCKEAMAEPSICKPAWHTFKRRLQVLITKGAAAQLLCKLGDKVCNIQGCGQALQGRSAVGGEGGGGGGRAGPGGGQRECHAEGVN